MDPIQKRIFIVGTARSGTTLLQSMVGNHPEVFTFPESHFFSKTIPWPWYRRPFHRIGAAERAVVHQFLESQDRASLSQPYTGKPRDLHQWARYLIDTLDRLAAVEDYKVWLEKTPMHLYYRDLIDKATDNSFFLQIIRSPISNVAALYDASKKYPDSFKQDTLSKAWRRYRREIQLANRYHRHPHFALVYYERLVAEPEAVVREICAHIQLPFRQQMLQHHRMVDTILDRGEIWKAGNRQALQVTDKVAQRLTPEEITWLEQRIRQFKSPVLDYYS